MCSLKVPLINEIYKDQKELPTIDNPSLIATEGSKPTSRNKKKLIVLNNFISLKTCTCIMREMKDASTDIIVVSNELFCKEEMAKDFDKHFSRGCNIIEVTSLQPISIMQRIVYALLEKNSFEARDADHIVFTLLSEYSRGAATIVHMLTSLMQKSEDNSRTGFELAKQQLKLHIAHLKVERFPAGQNITYSTNVSIVDMTQSEHKSNDISTSPQGPREVFASEATHSCIDDDTREGNDPDIETFPSSIYQPGSVHEAQTKATEDKELGALTSSVANTTSGILSMSIQNESYVMPNIDEEASRRDNDLYNDEAPHKGSPHSDDSDDDYHSDDVLIIQPEGYKAASKDGSIHAIRESNRASFVAGNDTTQTDSSYTTLPPTTAKPSKENLRANHKHPQLYMYINDILTNYISLPAHHLLNSLVITGPIPLPLFYVEELNTIVMNSVISKAESPMRQLVKAGVIRSSSCAMVYHKDLDPDYINLSIPPMSVSKLICDAVKDQMDDGDKALSVLSAQRALENLLANEKSLIHLRYILVICDQLCGACEELQEFDQLLIASLKIKLEVASIASSLIFH